VYSQQVEEHFAKPRNCGELLEADGVGQAGQPGRGNYMIVWVKLEGGCVVDASYKTYGCPPAIAAGSILTEMVKGASTEHALTITREQLIEAMGGLPLGREHCAALALKALDKAVHDANHSDGAEGQGAGPGRLRLGQRRRQRPVEQSAIVSRSQVSNWARSRGTAGGGACRVWVRSRAAAVGSSVARRGG
jgi:nitrogen fixation NifU-like protein